MSYRFHGNGGNDMLDLVKAMKEYRMNTVRAKFYCASKIELVHPKAAPICSYVFYLVASGNEGNKALFEASPAGKLELASPNDHLFEIGREYYLDFTPSA